MSNSNLLRGNWRLGSVSLVVAGVLAAFMLFLGVRGLIAPLAGAKGFGLPVADGADAVWLRIKAGRDICSGLTLAVVLALRSRRLMGAVLLANVLIPLNDMVVSLSAPVHHTVFAIAVHGGAATLMVVLAGTLLAGLARRSGERPSSATACLFGGSRDELIQ